MLDEISWWRFQCFFSSAHVRCMPELCMTGAYTLHDKYIKREVNNYPIDRVERNAEVWSILTTHFWTLEFFWFFNMFSILIEIFWNIKIQNPFMLRFSLFSTVWRHQKSYRDFLFRGVFAFEWLWRQDTIETAARWSRKNIFIQVARSQKYMKITESNKNVMKKREKIKTFEHNVYMTFIAFYDFFQSNSKLHSLLSRIVSDGEFNLSGGAKPMHCVHCNRKRVIS